MKQIIYRAMMTGMEQTVQEVWKYIGAPKIITLM